LSFLSDIAKLNKKLKKIVQDSSVKALEPMGRIVIDIIRKRTLEGYGVSKHGGSKQKLKPLSKTYIKFRQRNRGRLSSFASPGKSNLTFTGKMLLGMVQKRQGKSVIITFDSQRNKDVAGHVSGARPFMFLAKEEIDQVVKTFDKYFTNLVKSKNR
jgi:hypothetical protein